MKNEVPPQILLSDNETNLSHVIYRLALAYRRFKTEVEATEAATEPNAILQAYDNHFITYYSINFRF